MHDEFDHEDVPDEEPSIFRRVFVLVIGLFLIALMLSYLIVGFPLSDIIRGQLESNPLDGNVIELDEFSIYFQGGTDELLQQIYHNEQKVEFSVCLKGRKVGVDYYVESLYVPKMYEQRFNHVRFESCEDTLIMLHSHPYKSCLASKTDLETLRRSQVNNPDLLMVVMCEPKRFSVYK